MMHSTLKLFHASTDTKTVNLLLLLKIKLYSFFEQRGLHDYDIK